MYFLADFKLGDVGGIINNGLRTLTAWLCEIIYKWIGKLYQVFLEIGQLSTNDTFDEIFGRISLIIGIFMVFRVTFWLIELLLSPDKISDKEKGTGKIIFKVFAVVVLLAFTPMLFDVAYKIQVEIVDKNIIGQIIGVGNEKSNGDFSTYGGELAANLFVNFYDIREEYADDDCSYFVGIGGTHYIDIMEGSKHLNLNNWCLLETREQNTKTASGVSKKIDYYVIDFDGLFAVAVGGFVFWMILMYCISVGARYVQLWFLEIIAPIPIMCYLTPNKDNMFSKWFKQCTTTYLDLFIRIAIINFVVLLSTELFANDSIFGYFANDDVSNTIKIFIVLGLLTFAKKAPELIQELLPKSVTKASGDFGLSLKKRTDSMVGGKYVYSAPRKAIGFAAALPGVAFNAGVRAYNASLYNKREHEKADNYRNQGIANLEKSRSKANAHLERARDNLNSILNDPSKSQIEKNVAQAKFDRIQSNVNKADANLQNRIDKLKNSSYRDLRKELKQKNATLTAAYERVKDTNPEASAKLMEQITQNRESGMGNRNMVTTIGTSLLGGTIGAASSALHEKEIGKIVSNSHQKQQKKIKSEQDWYKDGGYSFPNIIQRTVSEVQRNFGIETEGQAIQYIIDGMDSSIKSQEEVVTKAQEIEKAFSSGKSSVKNVESEGSADLGKNKAIEVYNASTGQYEKITYSTRTGIMKNAYERVLETFKGFSSDESTNVIQTGSKEYKVLEGLINTISENATHDVSSQQEIKTELMNKLSSVIKNGGDVGQAFNSVLTLSNQKISKAESDYGKNQGAAGLLTYLFSRDGKKTTNAYSNQTIINEYESLIREITTNSNRYSPEILELVNKVKTYTKGKELDSYNETSINELTKIWSELKDKFDVAQAEQARIVSDEVDKVQALKHEKSAYSSYVETTDALNADKYNGGK